MTPPRKGPPQRSQFARALSFSLVLTGGLAVIGLLAARGDLPFFDEAVIEVSIDAPDTVAMRSDGATAFNVHVTIENRGANEEILSVDNPCNTARWIILAGGDVFVQAKEDGDCLGTISKTVIGPGEKLEMQFTITLDLRRSLFQDGGKYQLLVDFWGTQANKGRPHQFTLER